MNKKKKKKSPAKPAIYRLFDTNNVPAEDKHYPTYVWLSQKLFCNFGLSGIYNFDWPLYTMCLNFLILKKKFNYTQLFAM